MGEQANHTLDVEYRGRRYRVTPAADDAPAFDWKIVRLRKDGSAGRLLVGLDSNADAIRRAYRAARLLADQTREECR